MKYTIQNILPALRKKEISACELVSLFYRNIEKDIELNDFITLTKDDALKAARESDARYANGTARSLEGIPIAVKDLFCTKGVLTTAGSKMLANFVPQYESTVTQKLLDSGAIFLGKTNMDEFAMGSSNATSFFGPAINPWYRERRLVPGGSSGGSAIAVAGDHCIAALGSDTGGSVRQPAAYCGIVGIRPTHGRCSRYGMVAFASSLDQAGPMTKCVYDAAVMLEHIAGFDPKDSKSSSIDVVSYSKAIEEPLAVKSVGVLPENLLSPLRDDVRKIYDAWLERIASLGVQFKTIDMKYMHYGLSTYYVIAPCEASSNLARYDGVRFGHRANSAESLDEFYEKSRAGFGEEVRRRIMIGTFALSRERYDEYYIKAIKVRHLIENNFRDIFENDVDLIVMPTTATPAFPLDGAMDMDPCVMYANDFYTVVPNLGGVPSISVPIGFSEDGLPLGGQIVGPPFREDLIFNMAYKLEKTGV